MKNEVIKVLKQAIKKIPNSPKIELQNLIEKPKDFHNGDFAFPCFLLAKELKNSPNEIAKKLREIIGNVKKPFQEIQVSGPYLNFYIDRKSLAKEIITEIKNKNYGKIKESKKKILIEFPSPNTNKPLHLGHLRNMSIGDSISRISKANGFDVIKINLNNDRGIHICKSMIAYKFFGKNKTPEKEKKKSDHFVGDYYVKFAEELKKDKGLEDAAKILLKKWEEGDKETIELWKKMNKWALDGFKKTYNKFGISLDKEYFESDIYKKGKEIIEIGLKKKIFEKREDGAIIMKFEDKNLNEKVLLRPDGTSIYITQDLYLAKLKMDEFNPYLSVYVTGNEQDYHFNVLFNILDKLKLVPFEKLKHLSYGMVNLPNGRMKSREGTVVDADDLIEELQKIVKKELNKRYKLKESEIEKRALIIAISAIKYFLLKVDRKKEMVFNPEESISFEGDTGPYLLYSYARASSILKKSKQKNNKLILPENFEEKEIELILKLNEFKKTIKNSFDSMNPAIIANYAYSLSQIFNEFYHACPVLSSIYSNFRLELTKAFRQILKNSLTLLGIETLEEM